MGKKKNKNNRHKNKPAAKKVIITPAVPDEETLSEKDGNIKGNAELSSGNEKTEPEAETVSAKTEPAVETVSAKTEEKTSSGDNSKSKDSKKDKKSKPASKTKNVPEKSRAVKSESAENEEAEEEVGDFKELKSEELEYTDEEIFALAKDKKALAALKPPKRKLIKNKAKILESYNKAINNDIKYRGPLSYRHLRILAWLFIALFQLVMYYKIGMKLYPERVKKFEDEVNVISALKDMVVPFFLMANFAVILDRKDSYKTLIIRYSVLSALVFFGLFFAYEHYLFGIADAFLGDKQATKDTLYMMINTGGSLGYFCFNIFIDLLLCTLLMFFLEYRPKKFFRGKRFTIFSFRMMALIPILYEIGSIVIKILAFEEIIQPPIFVYPLLSTKPPISFIVFLLMVFFIKNREWRFALVGKTYEEFREYEQTNVSSWEFSKFAAKLFVVAPILDGAIWQILSLLLASNSRYTAAELAQSGYASKSAYYDEIVEGWGFGKSKYLLFMAPVMLLFSYTRKHKNMKKEALIPAVGVGLTIFMHFEGIYRSLCMVPAILEKQLGSMSGMEELFNDLPEDDAELTDPDLSGFDDTGEDGLDFNLEDLLGPGDEGVPQNEGEAAQTTPAE